MDNKRCGSCREILPLTEFIQRKDKPDKYLPRCKSCRASKRQTKTLQRKPLERKPSTMKRTALKPMSDRRKEVNKKRRVALEEHFGKREDWKCSVRDILPTMCWGEVNGHEILSRARAGRTDENLLDVSGIILVCNHHNTWIEDNPEEAHALGLTKHSWE